MDALLLTTFVQIKFSFLGRGRCEN